MELWCMIKSLQMPPIRFIYNDDEKVKEFAKYFDTVYCSNPPTDRLEIFVNAINKQADSDMGKEIQETKYQQGFGTGHTKKIADFDRSKERHPKASNSDFVGNILQHNRSTSATEHVSEHIDRSTSTATLMLDIGEAFEKVWNKSLIYKMILLQLPASLTILVRQYLTDRKFSVKIEDKNSTTQLRPNYPRALYWGYSSSVYIHFRYTTAENISHSSIRRRHRDIAQPQTTQEITIVHRHTLQM
ncbi:hypothetical protein Trydic_g18437, partial [Trypoxylus dichotomus]